MADFDPDRLQTEPAPTSASMKVRPKREYTRDEARETLELLRALGKEFGKSADGEPFAVAADEYYLMAGRDVPGRRSYGSFAQIENGVVSGWRAIIDGTAFDILGAESDSEGQMSRMEVRLAAI